MKLNNLLCAGLAFVALSGTAAAQTATAATCISEAEVSSLVRYGLPEAIAATRVTCAASLSPNGFLATGGNELQARYLAQKDAAWPGAKTGLMKFMDTSDNSDMASLAELPDDAVRPLIDALIQQKVAEAIKPDSCSKIERLAQVLAPMEPQELGALTGVIASLALKDKKPPVCPANEG